MRYCFSSDREVSGRICNVHLIYSTQGEQSSNRPHRHSTEREAKAGLGLETDGGKVALKLHFLEVVRMTFVSVQANNIILQT